MDDAFEIVTTSGASQYIFIEFLFGRDKRAFGQYFVKTAMATAIYGPGSCAAVVVQITEGPQKALEAVYKAEIDGIENCFYMTLVHLNDYLDEIESGALYEFAPLIPILKPP